jgi:DinB superfamily
MATEEQIANLLERLVGIPERIANVVAGWDATTLRTPAADGWSAAQILAHIRASDDILSPRIYAILTSDNPPLPAYDERRWAEVAGYANARFAPSLTTFRLRRQELVSTLSRIAPADWGRIGTHEEHGPLTLQAIVEHLVAHEEEHCAQLRTLPSPF